MRIVAIDPGPEESAYVLYDEGSRRPVEWAKLPNVRMREELHRMHEDVLGVEESTLAIEAIASYGMSVGAEVFMTCIWVGRFAERWLMLRQTMTRFVLRRSVKLHLCGDSRAKDANVRQAIIDRYGGKEKAIGKKATPGPLYGITGDCWSALAVAITAAETTP